jgi:hypothetical protein
VRANPRLSVGLPQLVDNQASDVLRRCAVRAEELGFARLWSLDSVRRGRSAGGLPAPKEPTPAGLGLPTGHRARRLWECTTPPG